MILRYGDETLKIVEAFAEHDFCPLRLIGMISAMNADNLSCIFCYYNSNRKLLSPRKDKGLSCGQKGYSMDKRNVPTASTMICPCLKW